MSYQQCLLNCVNILEDSQRYVHFIERSVGLKGGSHENMTINLTPCETTISLPDEVEVKPRFYLSLSFPTAKPQQSGGKLFLKNFVISQVV